jgi:superfamily II DNA or RNA helicase
MAKKPITKPPTKIVFERIVSEKSVFLYNNLPTDWIFQNIKSFSRSILELYPYQQRALQNIASMLFLAFDKYSNDKPNIATIKKEYSEFHFPPPEQLNRACFWMATGSGKTLVLIKIIEYIDYLMAQGLIPKKEIMLLLPKDNLIEQFKNQIKDFNESRIRKINAINLKEYENEKHYLITQYDEIKVYYYRSDLLRDEKKETILDYKTYENSGNWYVFLDEAHRGDSENSNLKDYVNKLSFNGFLFNFSATFTDDIDIITTCYNFNLEKFITAGYGKNILISDSNYTLNDREDEFTKDEKQKQILKSFIIYTLIKKSKNEGIYHNPLMLSLVNTVNTVENSDLSLFCEYMLKIVQDDNMLTKPFQNAINELKDEYKYEKKYYFSNEHIEISPTDFDTITISEIRKCAFNTKTKGVLEYYEGTKGKEIIFKLENASEPFALIKIGDTATFIKKYLNGYSKLSSYTEKNWFAEINNTTSTINILLGSRSFYEGWDSNRPNIINLINIGSDDAKKYIPQSIGRGVRIQPNPGDINNRKRLPITEKSKNKLLETLFIFPTDKKSIETILSTIAELGGKSTIGNQRHKLSDNNPNLFELTNKTFDLLLPNLQESVKTKFNFHIDTNCEQRFKNIFNTMSPATFLLQSYRSHLDKWSLSQYNELENAIKDKKFVPNNKLNYKDYNYLTSNLRLHINTREQVANGVRSINETEPNEDIIHFKHIEIELENKEELDLVDKITSVKNSGKYSQDDIMKMVTDNKGIIDFSKAAKLHGKRDEFFVANNERLNITKSVANHYYLPLLFADTEKINYITHIIKQNSEIEFVKNLIDFVSKNMDKIECDWMFSKIDETLDKIYIPYFYNYVYKKFYPDFIFWQKDKNSKKYKITFVDPKGTVYADYQLKIDGFKKLFTTTFSHNGFEITFDLKLVRSDPTKIVGNEYSGWWINNNDFDWLRQLNS